MNHGKIENQSRLDRMNRLLGRLMGKKDQNSPPKVKPEIPSNYRFLLILVAMLSGLWLLTGVYYVPDGSFGLIMINGKISKVVSGIEVGFARPYPFSSVVNFDASINNFSLGKASQSLVFASKENQQLTVIAEAGYTISDPKLYYNSFYQENSNLDRSVANIVETQLQKYFIQESSFSLMHKSSIVMANEVRNQSQLVLDRVGLSLSKLTINSIQNLPELTLKPVPTTSGLSVDLADQIMQQAHNYQQQIQNNTESLVSQFNQLLPQYRANPSAITELMYYKMLSSIPLESAGISYNLLNLAESQFLQLVNNPQARNIAFSITPADPRALKREVDRQRIFKGQ